MYQYHPHDANLLAAFKAGRERGSFFIPCPTVAVAKGLQTKGYAMAARFRRDLDAHPELQAHLDLIQGMSMAVGREPVGLTFRPKELDPMNLLVVEALRAGGAPTPKVDSPREVLADIADRIADAIAANAATTKPSAPDALHKYLGGEGER